MGATFIFDIDQTLIDERGAGIRAMNRAFEELFRVQNAFDAVEITGRTNGAIFRDCFRNHGMLDEGYVERSHGFLAHYLKLLAEELDGAPGDVMPGAEALLVQLAQRSDVRLGLGSGNFREAARLKLQAHGLWHYFRDGGFADDSEDRSDVIKIAVKRVQGYAAGPARSIYVVGDSPLDVTAAHANGLTAVGVATGDSSRDMLLDAGADLVFGDLRDRELFIHLLL